MTPCQHAKTCPRRMRDGDRPGGCSSVAQRTCSPTLDKLPVDDLMAESKAGAQAMHDRLATRYLFTMFKPADGEPS